MSKERQATFVRRHLWSWGKSIQKSMAMTVGYGGLDHGRVLVVRVSFSVIQFVCTRISSLAPCLYHTHCSAAAASPGSGLASTG